MATITDAVQATSRTQLTSLYAGYDVWNDTNKVNTKIATVAVGAGAETLVDNIGTPMIWVTGNSRFELYVAQDIAAAIAAGDSPLQNNQVCVLAVGTKESIGFNKADSDLATAEYLRVLYNGEAAILNSGITWGAANGTAQTAFLAELATKNITVAEDAEAVTPSLL